MISKAAMIGLALASLQFVAVMGTTHHSSQKPTAIDYVSRQINDFSFDLFEEFRSEKSNLVLSPISVWLVLFMAFFGTSGQTRSELLEGLHLKDDTLLQSFHGVQDIIQKLNAFTEVELHLANRMFVQKSLKINKGFERRIQGVHHAALAQLDFSNPEKARKAINDWVSQQTNSRINEILNPGTIDEKSSMVLVNTLYFKGEWAKKFDVAYTKPGDFHLQDGTTRKVPMMIVSGKFRFGEIPEQGVSFIELPYKSEKENETISMFVIIPENISNLENAERNLKNIWVDHLKKGNSTKCLLCLPKFRFELTIDLQSSLKDLEIRKMFGDSADFSHMTSSTQRISNIIQKVFVDVNESGTEAAAATESDVSLKMNEDEEIVKVDKPFIFLICTKELILFSAKIFDPTQKTSTIAGPHRRNEFPPPNDDQIFFPTQ